MAFFISPIGVILQYFNDQGIVLQGGKIWSYLAGTSTPSATYTDITGEVQNSNPIVLDSTGRLHNTSIWQQGGQALKFVFTDANNVQLGLPIDQVTGINDTTNLLPIIDQAVNDAINNQQTSFFTNIATNVTNSILASTLTPGYLGNIIYPRTQAEITANVVPTNFIYPQGNVLRYGADPTGRVDSTAAIQKAIDVLNNWQSYAASIGNKSNPGPDFSMGGDVFLPGGMYIITKTILLAPNIRLRGVAPVREHNTNYTTLASNQLVTILVASAGFPANQYMVDTGIYRLKDEGTGNAVTPYRVVLATDQFVRGTDADNAYCNFMINTTVQDMQLDCNNIAAGGIRFQAVAFSHIDGVAVVNPQYVCFAFVCCFEHSLGRVTGIGPMPLLITANESFMQDGGECQLYSIAGNAWVTGNQGTINAILYPFNDPIGTWYNLTQKVILVQWSINVTLGYLSANLGNVGLEVYHSNVNILHWENEFTAGGALFLLRVGKCRADGLTTKSASPLSTGDGSSRLVIREPGAIQCNTSFTPLNGEITSTFELQIYNYFQFMPDPILGIVTQLSTVNVSKVMPSSGFAQLYVDSGGNPNISGLYQPTPTTLEGAFRFISNNFHIANWFIIVSPNQTHTLNNPYTLFNQTVSIIKQSGINPTIQINNKLTAVESRISFAFCTVSSNQTSMLTCQGIVNVEFNNCLVNIPASGVVFGSGASTTAKVVASGQSVQLQFNSGSGMCAGTNNGFIVYEDSFTTFGGSGTPALEAITTGKVKKITSNVV